MNEWLLILGTLVLSGFFSGSEIAFVTRVAPGELTAGGGVLARGDQVGGHGGGVQVKPAHLPDIGGLHVIQVGAVRGIDPRSGHYYDDTKRYIDGNQALSGDQKQQIFSENARKVFSRLTL